MKSLALHRLEWAVALAFQAFIREFRLTLIGSKILCGLVVMAAQAQLHHPKCQSLNRQALIAHLLKVIKPKFLTVFMSFRRICSLTHCLPVLDSTNCP